MEKPTDASTSIVKKEQRGQEKQRSWADIPNGILNEVYSRVYAVDWYVFRSICTSWKQAHALRSRNQLECSSPYLLFRNNKIYHPISGAYNHYLLDKPELLVKDKPGAIVRLAKDGWFLVTYKNKEIFFYNPVTKAIVQLPQLISVRLFSVCFSAPPTSKEWTVIAAKSTDPAEITIYIIKDGEDEWSSYSYRTKLFWLSKCNAVIYKELLYCLGEDACLMVYDPKRNKFFFHKASKSICQEVRAYGGQQYMLECDGKLLAVFVNFDGSLICICRWNISKREWEKIESLGDNMLFVSAASSMCERAYVKGTGNKIYFPKFVGDHCLFYSMSTKKYHTFEPGSGSRESFNGSRFSFDSIWIKPQFHK